MLARPAPVDDDTLSIRLRWIPGYAAERRSDVDTGLLWTLSFLGAALPVDRLPPLRWEGDTVTLRLDRAGVAPSAHAAWRELLAEMKASDEFAHLGALDIGRFVALTLGSSQHYYALTGASDSYEQARARFSFDAQPFAIVESAVATGNRVIEAAEGGTMADIAFIAHEGTGSLEAANFRVIEHELLDIMPNGQLRFALYGLDGRLKPSASGALTAAGKPAKCLWCHETELSRPFRGSSDAAGYHSLRDFESVLGERMERLRAARKLLRSRIDFDRRQEHTLAELLYLSFYEPTAARVAKEWNMPIAAARKLLEGLPTHRHAEFDFLGDAVYRRADIDDRAPRRVMAVATDPRETSAYEPRFLQ